MLKALRMMTEKVAGPVGEVDAEDRKRVKDIENAALSLQKTMGVFLRVSMDAISTTAALHEDLANLYPAGQPMATAVAALNAATAQTLFADAQAMIAEARTLLEPPVEKIVARTKELLVLIDERHVCRAEVEHYKGKVTKLANEGLGDVKKQAKAESNQMKLLHDQKRLRELDIQLGQAVPQLDTEISSYCDKAFAAYIQLQANLAATSMNAYGSAIAAVPGAVRTSSGPTAGVLQPSKADAPVSKSEEPVFKPLADEEVVAAPSGSLSDFLGSAPPATPAEAPAVAPSEEEASSSSSSSSDGQQPDEGVPATRPASSSDGQSRGGNPFA